MSTDYVPKQKKPPPKRGEKNRPDVAGRKSQELLLFRPALTLEMKSIPEQEPTVDVYAADGELGVVILTITAQDLADTQLAPRRAGVHGVYNRAHLLACARATPSRSNRRRHGRA